MSIKLSTPCSLTVLARHACTVSVVLWLSLQACNASFAAIASDYILKHEPLPIIGDSLELPVFAAAAPGDPDGLYIVEQISSRIRRYDLSTHVLSDFVDMPDIDTGAGGERGLLGFAFHPDYATNGKIYVHEFDGTNVNIKELTHEFDQSIVDNATTKLILSYVKGVEGATPTDHTAGWIGFSPLDGYLYVPTGDGGSGVCANCGAASQDLTDLRGKMLRLDVDGDQFPEDPLKNYLIPSDNPFAEAGGAPEVFAYGLRNPWRAGFDSLTGDLYISDVGSNFYEEINVLPANVEIALNFGWRAKEGPFDNPNFDDPEPVDAVDPLYYYPNDPGAAAIVGGYVYRGSAIPGLVGNYIFTDFIKATTSTFDPSGGIVNDFVDRKAEFNNLTDIGSFAEDSNGELYIIRRTLGTALFKIVGHLRGDFNRDGIVDEQDLTRWQQAYALNGLADADGDGDSDGFDLLTWQRQLGMSQISSETTTVPAPCSCVLLGCGISLFMLPLRLRVLEV